MQELAKRIADWAVAEGCEQTTEGNWIFDNDEIMQKFGLAAEQFDELQPLILDEVWGNEAVADVTWHGCELDICLFLAFCRNFDKYGEE